MNKGDLINKIATDANISKSKAQVIVNSFLTATSSALKSGNRVTLIGFGTFSITTRSARIARNPRTGEPIQIPAKSIVKFKPGRELSDV
jgi:DNA-binding protein HU-beta